MRILRKTLINLILGASALSAQAMFFGQNVTVSGGGSSINTTPAHHAITSTPINVLSITITAGNLVIVWIGSDSNAGGTATGCSDAQGNTYTLVGRGISTVTNYTAEMWYVKNALGGTGNLTCTMTSANGFMGAADYAGASLTAPLDGSGVTTSNLSTAGPVTTALSNELLAVVGIAGGSGFTACTGYTIIDFKNNTASQGFETKASTTTGSYQATGCTFANFFTAYVMAAFK